MISDLIVYLTGPLDGQTKTLGRRYGFVNGRLHLRGSVQQIMGTTKTLARYYQAYPEGSQELREAEANGKCSTYTEDKQRSRKEVLGEIYPELKRAAKKAAHDERASGEPDADGAQEQGDVSEGDGVSTVDASEPPTDEEILAVVASFDPDNHTFFTKHGKPRLNLIRHRLGKPVTAEQLDAALSKRGD